MGREGKASGMHKGNHRNESSDSMIRSHFIDGSHV